MPREASTPSRAFERRVLQEALWTGAGLHRDRAGLERAAHALAELRAPEPGEDADLLQLGRLVVAAALSREESRGAHFRSDYPLPAAGAPHHTVLAPLPVPTEVTVPC
jgi:L-aspartate oxidase